MELGALKVLPDIRRKASLKLFKRQVCCCAVVVVMNMVNASKSMRCFLKGGNSSSLVQFSSTTEDYNDTGDCGGVVVFRIWSMSSFGMSDKYSGIGIRI
ncbi:hypothetical protein GQ457_06G036740 [Hibiscus cannabinus]